MQQSVHFGVFCCLALTGCWQLTGNNQTTRVPPPAQPTATEPETPVDYIGSMCALSDGATGDFTPVDDALIRPREAIELAQPFLDSSWYWRQVNLTPPSGYRRPINGLGVRDYLVKRDEWYHVSRDDVSFYDGKHVHAISYSNTPKQWFLPASVRVHSTTGEVIPPPASDDIRSYSATRKRRYK